MSERLSKLFLMLSSENEGEVTSAARAIGNWLAKEGKDWHDLAKHFETFGTAPQAQVRDRAATPARPKHAPRTFSSATFAELADMLGELEGCTGRMTTVERNFIEERQWAVEQFGGSAKFSVKQEDWMRSLYDKYIINRRGRR